MRNLKRVSVSKEALFALLTLFGMGFERKKNYPFQRHPELNFMSLGMLDESDGFMKNKQESFDVNSARKIKFENPKRTKVPSPQSPSYILVSWVRFNRVNILNVNLPQKTQQCFVDEAKTSPFVKLIGFSFSHRRMTFKPGRPQCALCIWSLTACQTGWLVG